MAINVLVVDDNIATCHLLIRCLSIIGATATCAGDGYKALASMAVSRPAIVFLDYMMPEMDGLEVLRRMQADPTLKTIPVVMFTANDTEALRVEAERLGAVGFLVKGLASITDIQRYVELVQKPK